MMLPNNTPKQFSWYENKGLANPQIEDGNTPDGSNQGKIYTSEITSADKYNTDYMSAILSAVSSRTVKGNDYSISITVDYIAELAGVNATNPGFYGSNLIAVNDSFTIESQSKDYVRGIITRIENVSYTQLSPTVFSFSYQMQCSVIQGNSMTITVNDSFVWKRSLVMDEGNFDDANPPIELKGSLNYETRELFFYWTNVNKESREYRLSLRYSEESETPNYSIIKVHGNTSNPVTALTPFISSTTGQISCIRIDNPGTDMNSDRTIDIKGNGSGALFATELDNNGSLLINEFYVYDATVGTNKIFLVSEKMRPEDKSYYPIPNSHSYAEGLPALGITTNFYTHNVVSLSYNQYQVDLFDAETGLPIDITAAWKTEIMNAYIKTHDGVYAINLGNGYANSVKAEVKKIPDNVKAYIDPNIPGAIIPAIGTTWAWTVAAIYDDTYKKYTQWAPEDYIHF